ncbi:hypothetical protein [Shimia sp.]|uniref:hypothetical protein n=1 Tax=Shimia sp. TaxID=1954381 RepID=UPI003565B98B
MNRVTTMVLALAVAAGAGLAEETRVAEDQTPTGKFLTAGEVRPILEATKGNWIAVREFNGMDLLYFTHLLAWRCGLYEVSFAVNGGEMQRFDMPDCDPANAMAVPPEATVYLEYPLGSIETVAVELLYDDLARAGESFQRANVMTP